MKKTLLLTGLLALLAACSAPEKQPEPTQIVDGKSIVLPPEFDVLPE